jgi:hypothetical protein
MKPPSLLLSFLLAFVFGCSRHEEQAPKTVPQKPSAAASNTSAKVEALQRQMAALEARCRSVQNTQQAVQFYKEMYWATYRENIYPTYRLLQDKAIAMALARDPSLKGYAIELRRSTEATYLALQSTNWPKLAEVQKQRKANQHNQQFMNQARRYLAMQDSFITAETLPLHEKMTDDLCSFLSKLHPDMAETIRLEHDLQVSKLCLQLQINQAPAGVGMAQVSSPAAEPVSGAATNVSLRLNSGSSAATAHLHSAPGKVSSRP